MTPGEGTEAEGRPSPTRLRFGSAAAIFVWSVWAAASLVALGYVARFGADVPRWDDYAVAPQLCGASAITLEWLWSQHSEHRIPIARLVLLGVFRCAGADPRPVMVLIVLLLAAGAAALLAAAGRAPGGRRYADAFLPLALLHLGHHHNLLWAIQITFVLPISLHCAATALVAGLRGGPGLGRAAAFGACLAVMPLCNAGGLMLLPAPLLWLAARSWDEWKSGRPHCRRRAAAIAACAAPATLLGVFYLRGYSAPSHHAPPGGPGAVLRATLQFLATALGPAGVDHWLWAGGASSALALAAAATLLAAWIRRPAERSGIGGLLAMLGSAGLLALATGWGRSGEGAESGLQLRYVTLAAPVLTTAFLAFRFHGGRLLRQLAPAALFATSCVLFWPNAKEALEAGRVARAEAADFDRERDSGAPLFRLVRRHVPFLHPSQQALHEYFTMLRDAEIGPFRRVRPDPTFRERPVELVPTDVRMGRWEDGVFIATGADPWIRFDLPTPLRVAGVRVHYDHRNDDGAPARFRLAWRPNDRYDAPETQFGDWNLPTGEDRTVTVWIDEPVGRIRLQPDNRRCRFRIRGLTLLVEP
ncbi:hypothetical protein [Paludisphaera mucosa]|uniref:F5/8 type C domain-containing protein n=1 Tax=Paludisphaera mucosa TaxID=3030827 RepID=A0ABT6FK15_9BACT|nr:hypothetical protein [Paludisphaera mucosa]MDG3007884.1 hypothetical protein [Paludisphaera mucosa]